MAVFRDGNPFARAKSLQAPLLACFSARRMGGLVSTLVSALRVRDRAKRFHPGQRDDKGAT
jgi:hypothetical protein